MDKFIEITETETGRQVKFIDSRAYTKNGETYYPGISAILDVVSKGSFYDKWLMSNGLNAQVLAKEAMNQGSRVHEAVQDLNNGKQVEFGTIEGGAKYTRKEWELINRYFDFYTGFKPDIMAVEKVLVSDILGFGSQLDLVVRLNDKIIIVDLKTGSLYDSAWIQLSAYRALWNEFFPKIKIDAVAVLHLEAQTRGRDKANKNIQGKGWKLEFAEDVDRDYEDFKAIHQIWIRKNPAWKPFNETFPATLKLNKE